MFVTNWISPTKIQKISEITNFFRHYFLSRTEVHNTKNLNCDRMFVHRTLPECNGKVTKPAKGHLHTFVRFRRLLHSFAFLCSLLHSFIRHANRS